MKIVFFTSNRADYGLFKKLLIYLSKKNKIFLINFGNQQDSFKDLNLKKIKIINIFKKIDNNKYLTKITFDSQKKILLSLKKILPNFAFIPGDRIEMIAPAICCYFMNIKIAHLHGGELTFGSKDDTTRHTISKLSNIHFVSHERYKKRLVQLGENKNSIVNCGSIAIANIYDVKFPEIKLLENKYKFEFNKFNTLISYHPTFSLSNDNKNLKNIFRFIKKFPNDKFFITSPNQDMGSNYIQKMINSNIVYHSNTIFINSFGNDDFLAMLNICNCIIGNSSSGIIEAPILKTYTINIGERQKGRIFAKSIFQSNGSLNSLIYTYRIIKNKKKFIATSHYYNKNTLKIIDNSLNKFKNLATNKYFHDQI